MTATVQFRIQLPLALRDRFKTICLRGNVTMTDRVVTLIEREVEGLGRTAANPTPKIATLNDDRLIARVVDASDKLGAAASSLSKSMQSSLDDFGAKLLRSIPTPQTAEQVAAANQAAAAQDQQRLISVLAKADALNTQIVAAIERGHDKMLAEVETRRTLLQMLSVGVLGGLVASGMVLWAIAGNSPARWLAVWLTGEDSTWHAAKFIAGDGSLLHGAYMSETHTLLKNPEFRQSYVRCAERAKTSKTSFNCTLRFPLLLEVR
ncbi:hypothetical protein ACFSAG_09560 [Sphingorhabdus buctiana]|uniref:Uncharacterized protein n=1 Tax=Sphingorhabdus buctiana TaxID=1508805 RepID=A0ABW4MDX0_9SPHN